MEVKELIIELLDMAMDDEVCVKTADGLKDISAVISTESEISQPRYYTEIILEK